MAQIGEPQKFIISEPMFEPIPSDDPKVQEPNPVEIPEEVPDGVRNG